MRSGKTSSAGEGAADSSASRIQAGTVWINQHGAIHPMVPFGGVKGSGWGVEFGVDGLKAVTQPQVISLKKKPRLEHIKIEINAKVEQQNAQ